jgi:lipopolysaccharide heptosyltransferase II
MLQPGLKKFLIVNPFGIGDVLFTTPVLRAIKENQPESIIVYWCNERVKDILKNNPNIDKIFALSRGDIKRLYQQSRLEGMRKFLNLLSGLKKEKLDILFDFSLDHRYSLISKLLGIKKRIGFNYKRRGRFLTDRIDIKGYNSKHVVEYYLDLLKFINIRAKSYNLDLFIPEADRLKSKQIFDDYGIGDKDLVIGIAPGAGASWGKDAYIKHWPAVKFAQLADKLINDFNAKIIVLGDESERHIADTVLENMRNKTVDLSGKTDLEELTAVMHNLALLITNDGGPLHMAVALGVKTISIFGPVDESVYGPYPPCERHMVVRNKDIHCRPCYKNFRLPPCLSNRRCIEDISVEDVFEAVRRLL